MRGEGVKVSSLSFAMGWIIAMVLLFLSGLSSTAAYLLPVWFLGILLLNIPAKIVFFAIVGYATVNITTLLKLSPEERTSTGESIARHKKVILPITISAYIDFILLLAISSKLCSLSSAGLLVPLVWYLIEDWLIRRGYWYLVPSTLVGQTLIRLTGLKSEKVSTNYLPGIISLPGKLQWMNL